MNCVENIEEHFTLRPPQGNNVSNERRQAVEQ